MPKVDTIPDSLYTFGQLFVLSNRIDTLMERALAKFGVSTKQWFLSICVASLFDQDPTLKELAKASGSSHQNVKQVALKLQQKHLLNLTKDPKDARVTRVSLSAESPDFWAQTDQDAQVFLTALYKDIPEADLAVVRRVYAQISRNLDQMETL